MYHVRSTGRGRAASFPSFPPLILATHFTSRLDNRIQYIQYNHHSYQEYSSAI